MFRRRSESCEEEAKKRSLTVTETHEEVDGWPLLPQY